MPVENAVKISLNSGSILTTAEAKERIESILRQVLEEYPNNSVLAESFFRTRCLRDFSGVSSIHCSLITDPVVVNVYFSGLDNPINVTFAIPN